MSRRGMQGCSSYFNQGLGKEVASREMSEKEKWIRANRNQIWNMCNRHVQAKVHDICNDKPQLLHKLMDSKDEYFRYCKATRPPPESPGSDLFVVTLGPSGECNDCCKVQPVEAKNNLFEVIPNENGGYLRYRYGPTCSINKKDCDKQEPELKPCNHLPQS